MVPLSRQLWRVPSSENIIERWNNCTHLNLACDPKLSKIWIRIPIKIKVGSEFKKSFGFFLNFIGVANHLLLLNIFEVMSKLIIISDFQKLLNPDFHGVRCGPSIRIIKCADPRHRIVRSIFVVVVGSGLCVQHESSNCIKFAQINKS